VTEFLLFDKDILRERQLLLNEVILALLEVSDPSFKEKYAQQVRLLAVLLSIFNQGGFSWNKVRPEISKLRMSLDQIILKDRQFFATQRTFLPALQAWKHRLKRTNYSKIPPKRYIGVGYKDKGSRKNDAYDGTPTWQEVAYSLQTESEKQSFLESNSVRRILTWSHRPIYDESYSWIRLIHRKLASGFNY